MYRFILGGEGKNVTETLTSKLSLNIFRAYKNSAITFGEMYTNTISNYISPHMNCGGYKSIEEWEPLGDPTLAIAKESTPPNKPPITGSTNGKLGIEYTFNATTTDIQMEIKSTIYLIGAMVLTAVGLDHMILVILYNLNIPGILRVHMIYRLKQRIYMV